MGRSANARVERGMVWTTSAPEPGELKKAGYTVYNFIRFRQQYIEPADSIGTDRKTLDNAAGPALQIFEQNSAVAMLNVPLSNYWELRALYGYVVEPAYRNDCALLIYARQDLDDLKPDAFVDPEFGYAWTLERLRHLADRYRRRSLDASLPPMTPIEEMLLISMRHVGLQPHVQYRIDPYIADFAFPERRLVVEADGRGWHDVERDRARDQRLAKRGWRTMRFSGSEIVHDAPTCAESISKTYKGRPEVPVYTDISIDEKTEWWRLFAWILALLARRPNPIEVVNESQELPPLPEVPREWCNGLDPSQKDAVTSHEGVVQILAPAGSGKTRVLVSRVQELVSRGVAEERILCATFNKTTEKELREKLEESAVCHVGVRTFHSVGHFILKEEGLLRGEVGSLSYAQWRRLCSLAKNEEDGRVWIDAPEANEAVSGYKIGQMITPDKAWEIASNPAEKTAARIYALYENELEKLNRNDYDDLVVNAVMLLKTNQGVRRKWQEKWQCVLVDEYQDIEPAQELLIQLLAAPEDCLMVVGDEDQCIYTWRRAEVETIINFDKRYPGLKRIVLPTCYRCPANVVATASRLIMNNKRRFPKEIKAHKPLGGASPFRFIQGDGSLNSAAAQVANSLKNCNPAETVLLARTSRLLRDVALACVGNGVLFTADEKVLRPGEAESVVLAYFRLLGDPESASAEDVDDVFRVPNRYLPPGLEHDVAQHLRSGLSFKEAVCLPGVEDWRNKRLSEGAELFDRLKKENSTKALLHALRTEGGLDKHYSDKERMSAHDKIEIEVLETLETETTDKMPSTMIKIMEARAQSLEQATSKDGVELATIHGSKGREWSRVIVYGWDRDQLPHKRGLEDAKSRETTEKYIEDERRLAYVAMTRTKEILEFVYTKDSPSQFLAESGLLKDATGTAGTTQYSPVSEPLLIAAEPCASYGVPHIYVSSARNSTIGGNPARIGKSIKSKFANTCPICKRSFSVGDWISPLKDNGSKRWVHARCPDQ
jgi:superfamily I DNA/RNA helicase/very-short-patch-repair endonuclease